MNEEHPLYEIVVGISATSPTLVKGYADYWGFPIAPKHCKSIKNPIATDLKND